MDRIEKRFLLLFVAMILLGGGVGYLLRCQSEACQLKGDSGVVHAIGEGAGAGGVAAIVVSLPALFSPAESKKRKP